MNIKSLREQQEFTHQTPCQQHFLDKAANIQRLKRINQDNNLLLNKMENIMSGTGAGYATFHKEQRKGALTLNGFARQREAKRIMEENYQLAKKLGATQCNF